MLSEYDCDIAKIKLVDPIITQLLKNYCRKDFIKIVFDDIGLADEELILFIVSNHDNDLMNSARMGAGGSHCSLLVYSKKQNTFLILILYVLQMGRVLKNCMITLRTLWQMVQN